MAGDGAATPGRPRIYLAGPDVFLPDPIRQGEKLKALCAAQGATGLFPMDNEIATLPPGDDLPGRIRAANMAMIRDCDAVVANMAPFRGPSMDPGTAYEMGAASALGRLVVGYGVAALPYAQRVLASCGGGPDPGGVIRDTDGMAIEIFDDPASGQPIPLADNLMMARGLDGLAGSAAEAIALAVSLLRAAG